MTVEHHEMDLKMGAFSDLKETLNRGPKEMAKQILRIPHPQVSQSSALRLAGESNNFAPKSAHTHTEREREGKDDIAMNDAFEVVV